VTVCVKPVPRPDCPPASMLRAKAGLWSDRFPLAQTPAKPPPQALPRRTALPTASDKTIRSPRSRKRDPRPPHRRITKATPFHRPTPLLRDDRLSRRLRGSPSRRMIATPSPCSGSGQIPPRLSSKARTVSCQIPSFPKLRPDPAAGGRPDPLSSHNRFPRWAP
jgi:hypothetical protein